METCSASSTTRLSRRGEGVGVRAGERGIEYRVLGLFRGGRREVDRVEGVALGVLSLVLGLVAVELGLLLVDVLADALDVRLPVVLDLLPAAARPVRGLFGPRAKLGRLLVGALARLVDLGLQLVLAL